METEKRIGCYTLKIKQVYDREKDDLISIKTEVNKELQDNLKKYAVPDNPIMAGIRENNFERYRVKTWVLNSVYSAYKEALFAKELIDNGKVVFKFSGKNYVDDYITKMKDAVREFASAVNSIEGLDLTLNVEIKRA